MPPYYDPNLPDSKPAVSRSFFRGLGNACLLELAALCITAFVVIIIALIVTGQTPAQLWQVVMLWGGR